MNFNSVLKKIDAIESNQPKIITESKKSNAPIQLDEGFDTTALKMLSGQQSTKIVECGMPGMGAPMPPTLPASLNMSAGNAGEIVAMMRGIMDLAKGDMPTAGMPGMGAPMPGMGGDLPSLLPPMGGMDDVSKSHGDIDNDGDHDMDDHEAEPANGMLPAGNGPVDVDNAGDQEIMDLIKKIRTGEPVKITTDNPVKVSTDQEVKKSGGDDEGKPEDEEYSNTPADPTKPPKFDPNSMADLRDKVDSGEKKYTPPGSGSNPMKDQEEESEDEEKKEESQAAFEAQLFADYKNFVNESEKTMSRAAKGHEKYGKAGMKALSDAGKEGKDLEPVRAKYNKYDESAKPDFLDMDKDGNKKEPMKKAVSDKKKNPFGNKK